jgi:hypothetical protein
LALGICTALLVTGSGFADFDLQVTEMWPGNDPGSNLSEDWFEITNFGDMPWTAAVDGDLWFDDDSFDPTTADLMSGIAAIFPGESVVFVDGGSIGATDWSTLWSPVVTLPQVGSYEGAGLSQGGDAVGIWISFGAPVGPPDFTATYPDATLHGGQSYDTVLGEFSTVGNSSGAVATLMVNDAGQPAIGSPGSVVPEPGSLALILIGWGALVLRQRR